MTGLRSKIFIFHHIQCAARYTVSSHIEYLDVKNIKETNLIKSFCGDYCHLLQMHQEFCFSACDNFLKNPWN